ncbi:MAG: AMP phosphorylase [Candidatus Aenigmatarchaeota archaeon]
MFLKAKPLYVEAKKPIVILNREDAEELDIRALDRVELSCNGKKEIGIVNITESFVKPGEIGLYGCVEEGLCVKKGTKIRVEPAEPPESLAYIKSRLEGKVLKPMEIRQIVNDVVDHKLSEIEITSFVISLYHRTMSMEEAAALSMAMVETGKKLKLTNKTLYDKHSIGGVPGDKTSMILVPTVAAAGLTIAKTSSRAITAPAGTADKMECICPVSLSVDDIKRVVRKTNGCLVWGGALDLAPADDIFIEIEHPLSIDPLLLPSVMSKKKAIGSKYLVVDIPTGKGVKIRTINEAKEMGNNFIELGKKLGIRVECVSTFGEQPIGFGIGPALEAREALHILSGHRIPQDQLDKVCDLCAVLFKFAGIRNGYKKAMDIIRSGKAERKFRQIIGEQGGDPKIRPEDIPIGKESLQIKSKVSGKVLWINNTAIVQIAREAGAPKDKGAGILLHKKTGDSVKKGETIFEIFAEKGYKLERTLDQMSENDLTVMGIGKTSEMMLAEIPEIEKNRKYFILER